jgi:hypothetical protein
MVITRLSGQHWVALFSSVGNNGLTSLFLTVLGRFLLDPRESSLLHLTNLVVFLSLNNNGFSFFSSDDIGSSLFFMNNIYARPLHHARPLVLVEQQLVVFFSDDIGSSLSFSGQH